MTRENCSARTAGSRMCGGTIRRVLPVASMRLTRPHRFQPVADGIIAGGRFPRTIEQSADLR